MKQLITLLLLIGLCPMWAKAQSIEEIRQAILLEMDRGVTLLNGESGYMKNEMQLLLSVVSNPELVKLQRLVRMIDPECFMIVNRVNEVWGNNNEIK